MTAPLIDRIGGEEGLRGYRGGLYLDKTRVLGRVEFRRDAIVGRFGGGWRWSKRWK